MPPCTLVAAGSGEADAPASVLLAGLKPDATYFYRVLATNALGRAKASSARLRPSAHAAPFVLPDGRAWEMVSPPDKHGAPVEALTREGGLILASEDGDALAYVADGAHQRRSGRQPQPRNAAGLSPRVARRLELAGSSRRHRSGRRARTRQAPEYQFFTPDLSLALVQPYAGAGRPHGEPPLARK